MSAGPHAFVIGWPISHSRSPLIHNHWLEAYGIAGSYEAVAVRPEELEGFLAEVTAGAYVGGNVTVPHKEKVFGLIGGRADAAAVAVEAVNTLYQAGSGRLAATNTDIAGFLANLDAEVPGWDRAGGRAVLLGGGGAARGIAYALVSRGLAVTVLNRTSVRAQAIAQRIDGSVVADDWPSLPEHLVDADILINATSLGMIGNPPLIIDLDPLPRRAVVADIVYTPLETPLLAAARLRGNVAVDGLGMLLHQAAPGFARWFGVQPAVTPELRALVVADLGGGEHLIVLCLTGSIGMGKTTTAAMFAKAGCRVLAADAVVHALYRGAAVAPVAAAFPGVVREGAVDRGRLADHLYANPDDFARIEAIVHPLVRDAETAFLNEARAAGAAVAVLDIPLLFEAGGTRRCDVVVVVTAPADVQRERVLARPGMSEARLAALLARQVPDAEKRRRADFIIDTGAGMDAARAAVHDVLASLAARDASR